MTAQPNTYSLECLIRPPKQPVEGKAPLILLLHGIGSNKDDLFSFADWLPAQAYVVSAQAPLGWGYGGYAWFELDFTPDGQRMYELAQVNEAALLISRLQEELAAELPIDDNEVILMGFSQGAIMSYHLTLSSPKRPMALVAMSGYAAPESLAALQQAEDLAELPVLITHGDADPVLPIALARQTQEALKGQGMKNITYKEYSMAHGVSQECLVDIISWLNQLLTQ